MLKNVLMVCLGNICRSPMAERLLKYYSKERNLNLNISSAGIAAMVGYPADPYAIQVMQDRGLDIQQHKPRQLTQALLNEADLVLVMEQAQQKHLSYIFPISYGKVHQIGKWKGIEIADPYQMSSKEFENACDLIDACLQDWLQRLWSR